MTGRLNLLSVITSIFVIAAALPAQRPISVVAFTRADHAIQAFSPASVISIPAVTMQVDINRRNGKSERGMLIVVYDPESGRYFWRYYEGDNAILLTELEKGHMAVYVGPTALVDFNAPSQLWVQQHTQRVQTLDQAERVSLSELEHAIAPFNGHGYHTGLKEVKVAQQIGRAFSCIPFGEPGGLSSNCGFEIERFVSISQDGPNWKLVVQNRYNQEIILDSNLAFVSTRSLLDSRPFLR